MTDQLSKEQISTEVDFYSNMFSAELNKIQAEQPTEFGPFALGHAFIWGHINVCVNEMTNKWKTYKTCLGSVCSKDVYGLANAAASNCNFATISHINMD